MGTVVFGRDSAEGNTNIYVCVRVCTRCNTRALRIIFSLGFLQESRKKKCWFVCLKISVRSQLFFYTLATS